MTTASDMIGWTGLQYFGRTIASMSHELKNALAIIKENAGLLNDYLLMIDKGMPLQPERLKIVADRIEQQTQRADALIKYLNRFGHSIDEAVTSVDLNEMAGLLATLSFREVAMQQATLHVRAEQSPVVVKTTPFWLLTLLGHCLTFGLRTLGKNKTLTLSVLKSHEGGMIQIEQQEAMRDMPQEAFPGESEVALLEAINASCHIDPERGTLLIKLSNR
jgi:C4-dicarboxylate-specific signal transduction histidine kinase